MRLHFSFWRVFIFLCFIGVLFALVPSRASANHSWGNYHWARTGNPFALKLADNLSPAWDPYLATTSSDWSVSSVLDTSIIAGTQNPRRCRPVSGRVEVCNYRYGNNGWLGFAQIWVSGTHIAQALTKVNDTYFNTSKYNTPAWKNLVMCQEVGHTLGLDHQDEIFDNPALGTCMDYTSDPTPNQHPNQHDYDQLELIYEHLDSIMTIRQATARAANGNFDDRRDWGRSLRDNRHVALFERDFGGGHKLFTFVVWAQE